MICIPITGPSQAQALLDIDKAKKVADILELRLDLINKFNLTELIQKSGKHVIVTYRPIREGGKSKLDDRTRLNVLKDAKGLGVRYIDVEWDAFSLLDINEPQGLIVSRHFFNEFPDNYEEIVDQLNELPAEVSKLAVKVESIQQNARIFHKLKKQNKDSILIGMGEEGLISRILGKKFGSLLTFASLNDGKESAPGQINAMELKEKYHYHSIDSDTKLYGVIGCPVSHSLSPDIHNAGFCEISANAVYVPLKVNESCQFLETIGEFFEGFSVTIPHKESFLEFINEKTDLIEQMGALNTLTKTPLGWEAMNTDVDAAISKIKEHIEGYSLQGKKVLVLGAGGAARALITGALNEGAEVYITNRTSSKGEQVALQLGAQFLSFEEITQEKVKEMHIIINTTSVGMHPNVNETPLPNILFYPHQIIFDAVYNPAKTKLIQQALLNKAIAITGQEMFVRQGALQFKRWMQQEAPLDLFRNILAQKLGAAHE